MNDLRDTRKLVGATITDQFGIRGRYAMAAQEAVYQLLSGNPGIELATLRFRVDAEHPPKVTVTGRVGSLVGPAGDPGELTYVDRDPRNLEAENECPSCHQAPDRPHTEYCRVGVEQAAQRALARAADGEPLNRPTLVRGDRCPCTYTAGPMEPDQHHATCPDWG